jgi:putative membrane protein
MLTLKRFLLFWISTTLALWIVDGIFDSLHFDQAQTLVLSGLILALVNLTIKPILLLVTLPLTVLSFGLALPLVNGLVLLGVAALVPGFEISGFWMGVLCALAISLVSLLINVATGMSNVRGKIHIQRGAGGGFGGEGPFGNGLGSGPGGQSGPADPNTIDVDAREKPSKNKELGD